MSRALVALMVVTACAPTGAPEVAQRAEGIVGGTLDAVTTAVFLLDLRFSNGDASICSATLVSPRTLLTAAHCVDPSMHSSTSVTVRATNKPTIENLALSDTIEVTAIARHPQWSSTSSANDLAMLLLARAPTDTSPIPVARSLPSGMVSRPLRAVGYGRTSAGAEDVGSRRTVTSTVTAVNSNTIEFGVEGTSGICTGDSGGPSFLTVDGGTEMVVGVHSQTRSASRCGTGTDTRVDTKLPFIDGFIATNDAPACTADGRCATGCPTADPDCGMNCQANGVCALGCASPDPDCCVGSDGRCDATCPRAGVVDPDCLCRSDGRCEQSCPAGRRDPDCACVADGRCEATCPEGRTDPDCGCDADGVCLARCTADPDCAACGMDGTCSPATCPQADPDCLEDGAVCAGADQCGGRHCLADPRGFSFCSRGCFEAAECQLDLVCAQGVCRSPVELTEEVAGGCAAAPGLVPWLVVVAWRRRRD